MDAEESGSQAVAEDVPAADAQEDGVSRMTDDAVDGAKNIDANDSHTENAAGSAGRQGDGDDDKPNDAPTQEGSHANDLQQGTGDQESQAQGDGTDASPEKGHDTTQGTADDAVAMSEETQSDQSVNEKSLDGQGEPGSDQDITKEAQSGSGETDVPETVDDNPTSVSDHLGEEAEEATEDAGHSSAANGADAHANVSDQADGGDDGDVASAETAEPTGDAVGALAVDQSRGDTPTEEAKDHGATSENDSSDHANHSEDEPAAAIAENDGRKEEVHPEKQADIGDADADQGAVENAETSSVIKADTDSVAESEIEGLYHGHTMSTPELMDDEDPVRRREVVERLLQLREETKALAPAVQSEEHAVAIILKQRKTKSRSRSASAREQHSRFDEALVAVREVQEEMNQHTTVAKSEEERLRAKLADLEERVIAAEKQFRLSRRRTALHATGRSTGLRLKPVDFDGLEADLSEREEAVKQARTKWLRVEANVKHKGSLLAEIEKASGGLHQVDLEQLSVENQANQEKMEERAEELTKVQQRVMKTVLVKAHVKEKAQHVSVQQERLRSQLADMDRQLVSKREALTRAKKNKEKGQQHNRKLKQEAAMLHKPSLLRDYETQKATISSLKQQASELEQRREKTLQETFRLTQRIQQATGALPPLNQ